MYGAGLANRHAEGLWMTEKRSVESEVRTGVRAGRGIV